MSSFEVTLTYQGQSVVLSNITSDTTLEALEDQARVQFSLDHATIRLLYRGKVLTANQLFDEMPPKNKRKILVMASSQQSVKELNSKRSDPTIRGFDQEQQQQQQQQLAKKSVERPTVWGTGQNKNYKFCRFEACTWQSFGHRAAGSQTPHAFQAMELLDKLASDPGIVAIMVERELVVGTLGEMDPIDDRLKQKHDAKGSCLLGYNTNGGARIDVKLRPDSLRGFLPYRDIVSTLIHELSHNWIPQHDLLFWTNFGQMRVEYLHQHATMAASGTVVNGKTTAELAGVVCFLENNNGSSSSSNNNMMESIATFVLNELEKDMRQHGLHPQMIAPAIFERCQQLTSASKQSEQGQRVVGSNGKSDGIGGSSSARERALAAAEHRAKKQQHQDEGEKK
jgi:hypothetical protein